jgi:ribosomal protein S18 acetylase RimI-like enzyme
MPYAIRELVLPDYEALYEFWQQTPNIGLSSADSRQAISAFLERNPGMSFVAEYQGRIVGSVLAGHDGRRGYLYHLAVKPEHRGNKVARGMVEKVVSRFEAAGVLKCHLMIFRKNEAGKEVWRRLGWELRQDIDVMSRELQ